MGQEQRGGIIGRDGEAFISATSSESRLVPPASLVHILGYADSRYGVAGLEATFDKQLSGRSDSIVGSRLTGEPGVQWNVHTTIEAALQDVTERSLGSRKGAVVVLNPWTGDILAATSVPQFDPSDLDSAMLASPTEAPLLNRALQGLYPPGSTFKPVIMAAALEAGVATASSVWMDTGSTVVGGHRFQNPGARAYGRLSPEQALARSSNVVFAELASRAGQAAIRLQAQSFGIGQDQNVEVPYRKGQLGSLDTPVLLAAAGIGQGEVLVTPLEMAIVAASIANGGYRVWPHLVSHLTSGEKRLTLEARPPERAMGRETAQILANGMRLAVLEGTAVGMGNPALLAGKTGTAENPHGEPHAWFVGFAPAHNPNIAIAVVVENAGAGARVAVPIAFEIAQTLAGQTLGR